MSTSRKCTTCNLSKNVAFFPKNKPGYETPWCKSCSKAWRQEHRYHETMERSNRNADKRAGRSMDELVYCTSARTREMQVMQKDKCYWCDVTFAYGVGVNRRTNPAAVTVDRLNNDLPHVVENCVLACMSCNKGHRNTRSL